MLEEQPTPVCPRCENKVTARTRRVGFLQTHVYSRFGKFPWECTRCRFVFLFKSRGKLKRRRRSTGEVHIPPVA